MASPASEAARTVVFDYFASMDKDRKVATNKYLRPTSQLGSGNGAGSTIVGDTDILAMLNAYPPTHHDIETVYAVPSPDGCLHALVTGTVVFGTAPAKKFTESFDLVPGGDYGYWVRGAIITLL